jgi:hypothetical protein
MRTGKGWKNNSKKRLSSWKGKHLTLINSVLNGLPMYMMSFFCSERSPKMLDYFWSRFFGQQEEKKKYRLAKWNIPWQPKDQGGLGIRDLDIQNKALLSKWLYRLLTTDGTWQQLIHNKYLNVKTLSQAFWKSRDSHFWDGLIEREMCPWAISKYFGDWVSTQELKCESMPMDEQSANLQQRYVSKS